MPNKIVGYARVSTDEQAAQGISLDMQREKIRAWANLNDVVDITIHSDDGISGKRLNNRPGLLAAIECAEPGDVFIVYSLSRLSRSIRDTLEIVERFGVAGINFVSIVEQFDTTTAMGRAFLAIIAVLNQLEREQISERTLAAMDELRRNGKATGHAPYGFAADENGNLSINDDERAGLRMIVDAMANDNVSYSDLANRLNDAGITPRKAKLWDRGVVRRICRSFDGKNRGLIDKHLETI
jgi:site-specific DNA recombinase